MKESSSAPPLVAMVLYLIVGVIALSMPELSFSDADVLAGRHLTSDFFFNTSLSLTVWTAFTCWWVWSCRTWRLNPGESAPREWGLHLLFGVLPLALVAAWCKPFLSADTTYYVCYGRQIAVHHLSPYKVNLYASMSDPLIAQVEGMWFEHIAFYGPVALLLYSIPSFVLSEPTIYALTSAIKFIWVPFYFAFGWVCFQYWDGESSDRFSKAMMLVANPIFIWHGLVDGHVDVLIALFLVLTALSMRKNRPASSAVALAVSASIKIVGIVSLPICFFWWLQRCRKQTLRFSLTFVGVYGTLYGLVGGGEYLAVVEFTKRWANLQAASLVPKILELFQLSIANIQLISNLTFYATVAVMCWLVWRGTFQDSPALAMACVMMALFFTRTYFQPWYTLWFWPLLWVACKNSRAYYGVVGIWTGLMLANWMTGWEWKGWLVCSGALVAFILSLRSQNSQAESLPSDK